MTNQKKSQTETEIRRMYIRSGTYTNSHMEGYRKKPKMTYML